MVLPSHARHSSSGVGRWKGASARSPSSFAEAVLAGAFPSAYPKNSAGTEEERVPGKRCSSTFRLWKTYEYPLTPSVHQLVSSTWTLNCLAVSSLISSNAGRSLAATVSIMEKKAPSPTPSSLSTSPAVWPWT